jgi:hypothetical protein
MMAGAWISEVLHDGKEDEEENGKEGKREAAP